MKLWQRIMLTVVVMLVASFAAGRFWLMGFDTPIPSYLAGMVGGLSAIPAWELMRWIDAKSP